MLFCRTEFTVICSGSNRIQIHTSHPGHHCSLLYFQQLQKPIALPLLSRLSTLNSSPWHTYTHTRTCTPQDAPGPPLSHPPLMLSLLIIVLVVAVVPPPGSCCNHSPRLARGVVGAVFCTGAGERWDGHLGEWPCFSIQEVWRQTLDTSKRSYARPWQYPLFPTLVALGSKSSALVPRQCRRFWSL